MGQKLASSPAVNHPPAINSAVFIDFDFGDKIVVSIVDKGLQKYARNSYAINYAIGRVREGHNNRNLHICLLYTSDAADEL